MDQEEIQREIDLLINRLGPLAEELFVMAIALERSVLFEKLRTLIQQKDSMNDIVAAETLAWAWKVLSDN